MGGISVLIMMGIFSSMIILFLLIMIAIVIWTILTYIFDSISIYHIAKKNQFPKAFLSFVPSYNKIYLGRIAGKNSIGIILAINDLIKIISLFLFCCITNETVLIVTFYISIITIILSIILKIYITHYIVKKVTPKYAHLLTILNSITLGITRPFMLFIVRINAEI